MAIVKAARAGAKGIGLDLEDFGERAEMLVSQAQQEAQRILSAARHERKALIESATRDGLARGEQEGHQRGLETGRKEGRAIAHREALDEISTLALGLRDALAVIDRERAALLSVARDDLLGLAIELCEHITRRRLEVDPGLVVEQVESVIELVSRGTRLRIALHPEDEPIVRASLGELFTASGSYSEIVVDPKLARGSCVLLGERGGGGVIADASISKQLERIARAILPDARAEAAA